LFVPFNARDRDPRTLFPAVVKLVSQSEFSGISGLDAALGLALGAVILLTVLLPPVLWLELTLAKRPLSRGIRALLIGQGIVGVGGVFLTFIWMSLNMSSLMFGNDVDPAAPGFSVILVAELVSCAASTAFGLFPRLSVA
jgi:hypothetical protein